ncbi:hypothetical protein D9M68_425510 [compost metagenome]|nr:hypothetical protein [Sinorhizobium sp. GL28]KSV94280.1 hypothetical protein N184_36885 [Sinorhizobium sp. GL28]
MPHRFVGGQNSIEDYAATAGAVRERAAAMNQRQPGDPDRLAQALVDLAEVADTPVRPPLGSDTIAAIEAKHRADAAIIAACRR